MYQERTHRPIHRFMDDEWQKKKCLLYAKLIQPFFFLRKPSAIISVFIDKGVCKLKQEEQDSFDR